MILAADIGGTKSLFALCDFLSGNLVVHVQKKYPSNRFKTLEEAVAFFFNDSLADSMRHQIKSACFSLAGPIQNGYCHLVNLNLTVNLEEVKAALSFIPHIHFYNDLVAVGHGLSLLTPQEFLCLTPDNCLNTESTDPTGNKAVLAPGTGLGESLIMGGEVYPSEGAHCDFGPRTEEEIRLWQFLHKKYGHVSYERLLSGPGLQNIYAFLLEENQSKEHLDPHTLSADIPLPENISQQALEKRCPTCVHALHLFVQILGAEAGNLALKSLTLGGIYLAGGIPPQILPKLLDGTFLASFRDKGRFSGLMAQIPVHVILNDQTALYGAALLANRG